MSKRLIVACSVLMMVLSWSMVWGGTISKGVIKLPHVGTEIDVISSPYLALTSTFKLIVESRTNGRFTVETYPNKQMGGVKEIMEQCARGMVWATTSQSTANLATLFPEVQVLEIPYLFETTELGQKVLDGPYGKKLTEKIAKKTGLRVMAWMPNSFRNFSNNIRPITQPEDMKDMRIRCMPTPVHLNMVKALGAAPTPISWSELYTALQTNVVDGQENAPYVMLLGNLQEVQKYYSLDHHLANIILFMLNDKFYQSLSAEDQWTMSFAARQAGLAFLGVVKATEARDLSTLSKSMTINGVTPENFKKFKALAQPAVIEVLKEKLDQTAIDDLFKAIDQAKKELGMM